MVVLLVAVGIAAGMFALAAAIIGAAELVGGLTDRLD